jgi:AcrR family transcriptional regulator
MLAMTRIVKNPEERRMELIDTAESLFSQKGYDDTAVSDIVKRINVGQGTFYYYFKSKEDILEAVAEKIVAPIAETIQNISKGDEDPATQVNSILNCILKAASSETGFMKLMHQKGNYLLHDKLEEALETRISTSIAEVIIKGMEEGIFNMKYPKESFILLLSSTLYISYHFSSDHEARERMRAALEEITARVLGIKDYRFQLEI